MDKKLYIALVVFACVALLSQPSEAGRRRNRDRNDQFSSRIFGTSDWFETTEEEGCANPPDDNGDGGDNGDGDNGDGDGEFDGRDAGEGGDETGPQTEKFFSLQGDNVCEGASEGDTKCVCYRGSGFWRFFRREYRLKCGTCQMSFIPEGRSGNSRRRFGTLVALDRNDEEHDDKEDFFAR